MLPISLSEAVDYAVNLRRHTYKKDLSPGDITESVNSLASTLTTIDGPVSCILKRTQRVDKGSKFDSVKRMLNPPVELIKTRGRCNDTNTSVLYASKRMHTNMHEIEFDVGDNLQTVHFNPLRRARLNTVQIGVVDRLIRNGKAGFPLYNQPIYGEFCEPSIEKMLGRFHRNQDSTTGCVEVTIFSMLKDKTRDGIATICVADACLSSIMRMKDGDWVDNSIASKRGIYDITNAISDWAFKWLDGGFVYPSVSAFGGTNIALKDGVITPDDIKGTTVYRVVDKLPFGHFRTELLYASESISDGHFDWAKP